MVNAEQSACVSPSAAAVDVASAAAVDVAVDVAVAAIVVVAAEARVMGELPRLDACKTSTAARKR